VNSNFYQIPASDFWPFVDKIREYYRQSSPLMQAIYEAKKEIDKHEDISKRLELSTRAFETLQLQHAEDMEAESQVFIREQDFLFRVLESSPVFDEAVDSQGLPLESVGDDDTLQWLDEQIKARYYFTTPLLTLNDVSLLLYDYTPPVSR